VVNNMINKRWFLSKTVWVNVIALIGVMLQAIYNKEVIPVELQATIISVINLLLRTITKENIVW